MRYFIAWNSKAKECITNLFDECPNTMQANYYVASLTENQVEKRYKKLKESGYKLLKKEK